jgi:cytochrome c553
VLTTRFLSLVVVAGMAVAHTASAADGEIEAIARTCAGCHGDKGVPMDPATIPIIWGQQESYLVKQMHDYRAGDRPHDAMSPIAEDVKRDDARKIATYFASKVWPESPKAAATSAPRPKGIEQCQACHGAQLEGSMGRPRLAGLSSEYLIASMNQFAGGQRTNNNDMPLIMRALSESERKAMARYISEIKTGAALTGIWLPKKPSDPIAPAPKRGFEFRE